MFGKKKEVIEETENDRKYQELVSQFPIGTIFHHMNIVIIENCADSY